MIILTGPKDTDKKNTARALEKFLIQKGKIAYYLGIGNLLYGVDADIKSVDSMNIVQERQEHIRRLGEVANLMLDAGNILIVTASELSGDELDTLRQIITTDNILTVWLGPTDNRIRDFEMYFDDTGEGTQEDLLLRIEEKLAQTED